MRCLSLCLLLCVSGVLAGNTIGYTYNSGTTTAGWRIDTFGTVNNPPLTFIEGNSYVLQMGFDNGASQPQHPFALSADGTTSTPSITTIDAGFTVTASNCTGNGGASTNGWKGMGCFITITPAVGTAGKPIFYRCTFHQGMVGQITVVAATAGNNTAASSSSSTGAASSSGAGASSSPSGTVSSTGGAATTSPPTLTPDATLTGTSFRVTNVLTDSTGPIAYIFTGPNGQTYVNPTLSVTPGTTVTFSLEYSGPHPFGFSPTNGNTVAADTTNFPPPATSSDLVYSAGCNAPVNGVPVYLPANPPSPCTLTVPVTQAEAGTTLFYRCAFHSKMIGQITVTGTKNTASHVTSVGAVLALVMASIAAICA